MLDFISEESRKMSFRMGFESCGSHHLRSFPYIDFILIACYLVKMGEFTKFNPFPPKVLDFEAPCLHGSKMGG